MYRRPHNPDTHRWRSRRRKGRGRGPRCRTPQSRWRMSGRTRRRWWWWPRPWPRAAAQGRCSCGSTRVSMRSCAWLTATPLLLTAPHADPPFHTHEQQARTWSPKIRTASPIHTPCFSTATGRWARRPPLPRTSRPSSTVRMFVSIFLYRLTSSLLPSLHDAGFRRLFCCF